MDTFRHITATRQHDVTCVRLKHARLEEGEIAQLADEVISLCRDPGCKLALSLGPQTPYCLYSVFLAKLITIRNAVVKAGGRMVLCDVGPNTYSAFEATRLHQEFTFVPDFAAAVAHFANEG
jgi:hypothetical protein